MSGVTAGKACVSGVFNLEYVRCLLAQSRTTLRRLPLLDFEDLTSPPAKRKTPALR
jgi:hypothetical protein